VGRPRATRLASARWAPPCRSSANVSTNIIALMDAGAAHFQVCPPLDPTTSCRSTSNGSEELFRFQPGGFCVTGVARPQHLPRRLGRDVSGIRAPPDPARLVRLDVRSVQGRFRGPPPRLRRHRQLHRQPRRMDRHLRGDALAEFAESAAVPDGSGAAVQSPRVPALIQAIAHAGNQSVCSRAAALPEGRKTFGQDLPWILVL
jgi:hypothetical protein